MAEVITMPRLSDTMTEGKVAKWNFNVGDSINEGDILAEIETDKAVQDFESEFDGKLLHIGVQEGDAAPVDAILAIIGQEGEDISQYLSNHNSTTNTTQQETISEQKTATQNTATPAEIPNGVEVINMPRLSDTMTEGKVAKWNFNVGDTISEGDILAEIETDKAVQDFESEFDGVLLHRGVEEGGAAPVDTILAIIGEKGTDISTIINGGNHEAPAEEKNTPQEKATPAQASPINTTESTKGRIAISPLAKKMAKDRGIDITTIKGSGENGRIIKKDIENHQPSASKPITEAQRQSTPATQVALDFIAGETTETPNSQVRNIIAKRLSESKYTAPHYYLMVEIDMDNAIEARKQINALPEVKISYNDMIIKAVAMALRKHPQVNSSWAGDKIVHHGAINVGVAVAIPDGLVVPVLKNTDYMNYQQISASVKDLATRARNKGLKANEMEGSTFSISNLGMYGIETFTSIINQPNSAILSVGAIIQKPVVKNGEICVGNTMKLSLACDHRVVDGATGAEFLQTLRTYLEQPLTLLL